jgi:hypothetical protein
MQLFPVLNKLFSVLNHVRVAKHCEFQIIVNRAYSFFSTISFRILAKVCSTFLYNRVNSLDLTK